MKEFFWKYDAEIKAIFIVFNLVLGTYVFILYRMTLPVIEKQEKKPTASPQIVVSDECGDECQRVIDESVAQATATLSASPTAPRQSVSTTPVASVPVVAFIPLGSGGSTKERDWITLDGSQFNFDLRDYPAGVRVYWQGNIKARYSHSRCYTRIYDESNLRAVDFSEQATDQTTFQNLTSQPLTIWAGENKYRLEIKSLNGITCYLESPRLVIKY